MQIFRHGQINQCDCLASGGTVGHVAAGYEAGFGLSDHVKADYADHTVEDHLKETRRESGGGPEIPTHVQIARLAHRIWLHAGSENLTNWLQAETILLDELNNLRTLEGELGPTFCFAQEFAQLFLTGFLDDMETDGQA